MNVGITPVAVAMTTCFVGGVIAAFLWQWDFIWAEEVATTVGGAFLTVGIVIIQWKSDST